MFAPFELGLHVIVLVSLAVFSLLPTGCYILRRCSTEISANTLYLLSYGFGALSLAAIVSLGKFCGLSNEIIAALLFIWVTFAAGKFVWSGNAREYFQAGNLLPLTFLFAYTLFLQLISAFPDGDFRRVEVGVTRELVSLPTDNFIPYNLSRMIVEGLKPSQLDVVPGWKAGDRGPLAALVHSAFMIMFGAEEHQRWLDVSTGLFFVYQTFLTFLNGLSLLAVWYIAFELFGRCAALWSVTLLSVNYFYLINMLFSWPKFLMAYYLLCGLWLWQKRAPSWLVGICFGASILCHDAAVFSVLSAVTFYFLAYRFDSASFFVTLKRVFQVGVGMFATYLPWAICKKIYMPPSGRLFQMHFFCDMSENAGRKAFLSGLKNYWQTHSVAEIFGVRVYNAVFPLDPTPVVKIVAKHWADPIALVNYAQNPIFFEYLWGIGIFPLLLLARHFRDPNCRKKFKTLVPFMIIGYSAVFFFAAISGCKGNTVSHVWAYPIYLVTAIMFGALAEQSGIFTALILVGYLCLQALFTFAYVFYHPVLRPFLHGSTAYFLGTLIGITVLLLVLILAARRDRSEMQTLAHAI